MRTKLIRAVVTLAMLTSWGACGIHQAQGDSLSSLLTSLQATTAGDSAYFLLQVTNPGSESVALEFAVEPFAYFTVARDDLPLWQSATELTPTADTLSDTLHAGETRSFQASWAPPLGLRGTMTVTGILRDRRRPLVQSTRFDIQ